MRTIDCPQLSPEWWRHHKGRPSASNFGRIMTPAKRNYSAQALKYACELVAELVNPNEPWLSPSQAGPFRSTAMENGLNFEDDARRAYAMLTDNEVRQVGLCIDDSGRFICSPDGLIGDDGGLELKVPQIATQAEYLLAGGLPPEYAGQVHGSLIVTGREWWDFFSYAPGLPPLRIRVEPDDFTAALRRCLDQFWDEYAEVCSKLGVELPAGLEAGPEPTGDMGDWAERPAGAAAR